MVNILLTALMLFQVVPPQAMQDNSVDKTHKAKHKVTLYYMFDKKTVCGAVKEFRNGTWAAYKDKVHMQSFDTEAAATKYIGLYCPVAGTPETK